MKEKYTFYCIEYTHMKKSNSTKLYKLKSGIPPPSHIHSNHYHEECGVYVGEYMSHIFVFIIKLKIT